jgi:hypothetical protein
MTNRLSILGKVNVDGRGGYGNLGKFGGFRLKTQKTSNIEHPTPNIQVKKLKFGRGVWGLGALVAGVRAAADPASAGHSRAPGEVCGGLPTRRYVRYAGGWMFSDAVWAGGSGGTRRCEWGIGEWVSHRLTPHSAAWCRISPVRGGHGNED